MTWVITSLCRDKVDMSCVEVCPVDCIVQYTGDDAKKFPNQLYIDPEECINCGVCEPECPVNAIVSDVETGSEQWLEINTKYSELWPNITEKKDPPSDHKKYEDEKNKFDKYFKENL